MPDTTTTPLHVFGSFGYGNLGDELVPGCLARLLESVGYPVTPIPVTRFHGDLPVEGLLTRDTAPAALADVASGTPLVITGGGIIEPRAASCLNRAFNLVDQVSALSPLAFAISVEPGVRFNFRDRRRLHAQLARLGPVAVRDDLSARVLRRIAPNHPIRTVGDIALWTSNAPSIAPETTRLLESDPGIVVILQPSWTEDAFFTWLADDLATLSGRTGLPITVLPFAPLDAGDLAYHKKIVARLRDRHPEIEVHFIGDATVTVSAAVDLLSRARLCISTRLHGCVVAFAQRTPFVALSYHPKLKGFAETVNWEHALLPQTLPAAQTDGVYGYAFSDLEIAPGDLITVAERVMDHDDFSAIAFYSARQQAVIREMLCLQDQR